jgi:hypothetical protein
MIRISPWRVIWDVGGTPATLLDYGDDMDQEIRLDGRQLTDVGAMDFATGGLPVARKNLKRQLEFSRRLPHPSAAASWQAVLDAVRTSPWGVKAVLTVQPLGGTVSSFRAALLSCRHKPDTLDGIIESVHSYAFRIVRL